jgi:hypothetical protein
MSAALACSFTPPQVLQLLLDILVSNDNSSNPLDDGHWLAGLVAAVGQLRLRNTVELAKVCEPNTHLTLCCACYDRKGRLGGKCRTLYVCVLLILSGYGCG